MNDQAPNSNPVNEPPRCQHRTAKGRRCRHAVSDAATGLCARHVNLTHKNTQENAAISRALLRNSQGFQTAQGVNFALTDLYELLAANRISARRASVLAYINSLLLRTLPAIDADREAGITHPDAPEEATIETASLAPNPRAISLAGEPVAAHAAKELASTWDASIPEPDTTKKPS